MDEKQGVLRIESNVEDNDSDVDSDSDVVLSDGDYEDSNVDDLFAENIDIRLEEVAPRIESDVLDVLNRELADEEARNNYQDTDDELVKLDVELNSLDGFDDEKEKHYPVFNQMLTLRVR